jgi:hypothetical protein
MEEFHFHCNVTMTIVNGEMMMMMVMIDTRDKALHLGTPHVLWGPIGDRGDGKDGCS